MKKIMVLLLVSSTFLSYTMEKKFEKNMLSKKRSHDSDKSPKDIAENIELKLQDDGLDYEVESDINPGALGSVSIYNYREKKGTSKAVKIIVAKYPTGKYNVITTYWDEKNRKQQGIADPTIVEQLKKKIEDYDN